MTSFSMVTIMGFGQCTTEVLLPAVSPEKFNNYGEYLDTDNDYLVVSAYGADSLEANNGLAFVYKLTAENKWNRIAVLAPSDPQESLFFGRSLAIDGNTIVIHGQHYDVDGNHVEKIYVFEKEITDEWSSGTESYQIIIHNTHSGFLDLALQPDELIVSFVASGVHYLKIFEKENGIFSPSQQLVAPLDFSGRYGSFGYRISVENEFLAVAAAQFVNATGTVGKIFLYEKLGEQWSSMPVAELEPSEHSVGQFVGFGEDVLLKGNSVFVHARSYPLPGNTYASCIYFYDKPDMGWTNGTETTKIVLEGTIFFEPKLSVEGDYFFVPHPDWSAVDVFKKNSVSWATVNQVASLETPVQSLHYGRQISVMGDHLIISGTSSYLNEVGNGLFVDYYQNNGEWENSGPPHQVETDESFNASNDDFGEVFAVSSNYLAIGAPGDDTQGNEAGAVHLFTKESNGWQTLVKLLSPYGQKPYDHFGHAVAMTDSILYVSAVFGDTLNVNGSVQAHNIGKVFVYRLTESGWVYFATILAPQVQSQASFGQYIACVKGYVAISEYYTGTSESDGRVHVYKMNQNQWTHIATLRPEEDIRGDFFGRTIAMNDSLLVIGTGNAEFDIRFNMKVFVYVKDGEWKNAVESARLLPTTKTRQDRFGFSVAMHGNYIVVGAPYYPTSAYNDADFLKGAAYVFEKPVGGWVGTIQEKAQLLPSDPVKHQSFGYSVAITEDEIFIGAPSAYTLHNTINFFNNDDNKTSPGKVYHYVRKNYEWVSTTEEDDQFSSIDPEWLDAFGMSLQVMDRRIYVGAPLDDTPAGYQSGSVQVFVQQPVLALPSIICSAGGPVQLLASPSGGTWSGFGIEPNSDLFDPTLLEEGEYELAYLLGGCTTTQFVEVMDNLPEILNKSDTLTTKCPSAMISLLFETTTDPMNYSWLYKEKNDDEYQLLVGSTAHTLQVTEPGYYRAIIDYPDCPAWEEDFHVVDDALVSVSIASQPIICSFEPVQLNGLPLNGTWSGEGNITPSGELDPATLPDGNYTVVYTIITSLGCEYSTDAIVAIDKLAKPAIVQLGGQACYNDPVKLVVAEATSSGLVAIQWYKVVDTPSPVSTQHELLVYERGQFFVEVTKHTCVEKSEAVNVSVKQDTLFVPNVFTPNGDSFNPFYEIRSEGLNDFSLVIFNRYGNNVFLANDPEFKWDGSGLSAGVYYFYLKYKACDTKVKEYKGPIHLFR